MPLPGVTLDKILIIWLHLMKKKGDCKGEKGAKGHKDSEILFQQNLKSVWFHCFCEEKPTAVSGRMSYAACITKQMREKNESVFLAGWACPLPAGL